MKTPGMHARLTGMERFSLNMLRKAELFKVNRKPNIETQTTSLFWRRRSGRFPMDDTRSRLSKCFSTVFPTVGDASLMEADATNVEGWDSVASVTLFALIEEEFGVELDVEALMSRTSFKEILKYLEERTQKTT
jgi:acyl carrier protein